MKGHIKGNAQPDWLPILHLFYASLFAFVLPFLCWGTQGTPDHPHASPHFVFAEPVASEIGLSMHGLVEKVYDDNQTHPLSATKPTGRAVPAVMVITLLVLLEMVKVLIRFTPQQPNFHYWLPSPHLSSFCAPILTPPPR